jgi:hypothetical protein
MTITLTREEAQQVLEHLDDLVDAQQWEIDMHSTQYGEGYKPQRMKHMKEQLANTNKTIETLRARLSAPEPEPVADKYLMEVECTKCGAKQEGILTVNTTQQRNWNGLTEQDFSAINQSCSTKLQAATSAESILKEKNT